MPHKNDDAGCETGGVTGTAGSGEALNNFFIGADTGFIGQNAYLFCASEGLGTFVYYGIYRMALAEKLGLHPAQKITLGQAVGYKE